MTAPDHRSRKPARGLTFRSVVVCLVALFFMAIWVEYEERYTDGGPLAENSPPNSAVGIVLLVMGIGTLLYKVRRSLRLSPQELMVVYAALVVSAPLMTQGLWGRLVGMLCAIPANQDFKSYESLPEMLWPHGPNLVANGLFEKELEGFRTGEGTRVDWAEANCGKQGHRRAPVISGTSTTNRAYIGFSINRFDDAGREVLVPGERFLFSMLARLQGLQKGSAYSVTMQADTGVVRTIYIATSATRPSLAQPDGFERLGVSSLTVPPSITQRLTFTIGISGAGQLALQDLQFLNVEAVEGVYSGRRVASESEWARLGPDERAFTIPRPDNLLSLRGVRYLLAGMIPLDQWAKPVVTWSVLFAALFAGFLGLNILMRKQWVEHERFSFPLTIIPKNLFAETDENGRRRFVIFRNRLMWIGFAVTLPLALLKGFNYYNSSIPAPVWGTVNLDQFVANPLTKAYLADVNISPEAVSIVILAVALLIETDVLFSLWSFFLIFQLFNLFGPALNFNRFPGYPWRHQQAMGAFIAYAALAIFVGRKHLRDVFALIARRKAPDSAREDQMHYRVAAAMVLISLGVLAAWGAWTRMGVGAGLLFFGYMLVLGFAASKLRAECGAPFSYMTPYYGMQFVAAVGGFAVFGSTGMLVATIAAGFMTTAGFLLMSPAQVEMMELGRHFNVRLRDLSGGLWLGLAGGIVIGGFAMLCWTYGLGADSFKNSWWYQQTRYFDQYRSGELSADRALATGTLTSNPETRALDPVHNQHAKGLTIGVVGTLVISLLRSQFMWFPFHPIGYVLAASHFVQLTWFAALLAWVVRSVLFRLGGAQAIRRGLVPFCVGMFLAAIVSILFFDALGMILRAQGVADVYSKMP